MTDPTPPPALSVDDPGLLLNRKVLLADPHDQSRAFLKSILTGCGVTGIRFARNAYELRRAVEADFFDLILCDHLLDPKVNGVVLLEALRHGGLPMRTAFLIVTTESKHREVTAAVAFAPDEYILKPLSPAMMMARLTRTMHRKTTLYPILEALDRGDHAGVLSETEDIPADALYRIDRLRLRIEALMSVGRNEEAAKLTEAILAEKVLPWAKLCKATLAGRMGNEAEALQTLQDTVHKEPRFAAAHDALADLHEHAGRRRDALTSRLAATGAAGTPKRWEKARDTAKDQGNWRVVEKASDALIAMRNDIKDQFYLMEAAYRGDRLEAMKAIRKSVYMTYGQAGLDQMQEAEQALVASNPVDFNNLAVQMAKEGRLDEALGIIARVAETGLVESAVCNYAKMLLARVVQRGWSSPVIEEALPVLERSAAVPCIRDAAQQIAEFAETRGIQVPARLVNVAA